MFEIVVEDEFAAAHFLRNYKGKCENLHGHNYRVMVKYQGKKLGDNGLLIDFHEAKLMLKTVLNKYDHVNLAELAEFKDNNPTAEHIARQLYDDMLNHLQSDRVQISEVTVWETPANAVAYRPD